MQFHINEVHNLIPIYLLSSTVLLTISCLITLFVPYDICTVIPALTTYGKSSDQLETYKFISMISVPKRWFRHFYALGTFTLLLSLHILYTTFIGTIEYSKDLRTFLIMLTRPQSIPSISFTTCCLAIGLLTVHVIRRFYETVAVSVYSDSRMNIFHYAVGLIHYTILPFSILCETEGLATNKKDLKVSIEDITTYQWIGAVLFIICNIQQHEIAEKIANTRKGPRGLIRNYAYGICFGGWFNYVSCPHFFFEILIYLSLYFVVPTGFAYKFVLLFVFINQIFAAEITHRWYQRTFPKYPPNRKSIIPFIL
ncbi:unnamed protein product [Caenorhabditis bovis]|uniref:Polyprenal reductase n=1 Tax=Caenorhabditis bovis TaxID=2654633 RepID=A0A8S1EFH1_9PELO|nr:unnamed protein product [Caenorhabditis bovis]